MSLDFNNAEFPRLLPLEKSFAADQVEAELKQLFIDLFAEKLAAAVFDANVLGAAHLGSLDLVRKSVNSDGLALFQGDREEAATRYLYRAWKSGNVQGRGLHFLRTYLQMLYPNTWSIEQMWQNPSMAYTSGMLTTEELNSTFLDPVYDRLVMVLTSRVKIAIDHDAPLATSFQKMLIALLSILPARIVPEFRARAPVSIGTGVGIRSVAIARLQ